MIRLQTNAMGILKLIIGLAALHCTMMFYVILNTRENTRDKLNCPLVQLHTSHTHNITCHVYICRWTRLVSWPCAMCPETPPATSHLPSRAPCPPPSSELLPSLPTPRQSGWVLRLASMCQHSLISLVQVFRRVFRQSTLRSFYIQTLRLFEEVSVHCTNRKISPSKVSNCIQIKFFYSTLQLLSKYQRFLACHFIYSRACKKCKKCSNSEGVQEKVTRYPSLHLLAKSTNNFRPPYFQQSHCILQLQSSYSGWLVGLSFPPLHC